jgi:hypothetical protein
MSSTIPAHVYEVRPRRDKHGVDLISDALPFGRLWYGKRDAISNAIGYAKFRSRSPRRYLPPAFGDSEATSFWKRGSFRS